MPNKLENPSFTDWSETPTLEYLQTKLKFNNSLRLIEEQLEPDPESVVSGVIKKYALVSKESNTVVIEIFVYDHDNIRTERVIKKLNKLLKSTEKKAYKEQQKQILHFDASTGSR